MKGKGSGLVIAPDLFSESIESSYTADEWKDAEKEHGLVFLPKAGIRKDSNISSQEAGHYWCSTTSAGSQVADYFTITDDFDDENFMDGGERGTGRSIRLVRDVN